MFRTIHGFHDPSMSAVAATLLPLSILATGCSGRVDGASQSEPAGKVSEAFSGLEVASWLDTVSSSTDLGPASGGTCFMAGLTGTIEALTFNPETVGAGVALNTTTNEWSIFVRPSHIGPGPNRVGAQAECVGPTSGQTAQVTWRSGQSPQLLGAVTPSRRCFLQKVGTTSGIENVNPGFRRDSDNIRVTNDGTNWWISGSQSGQAFGTAQCIDVTQYIGSWAVAAPDSSNAGDSLADSRGGVACLLTGIGGGFTSSDWESGVQMFVSQTDGGQAPYGIFVTAGKSAWVDCVR
jgi:hypothetical protein